MEISPIPLDAAPLGRGPLRADREDDQQAALKRGWSVTLQSRQTRLCVQVIDSFDDGCYLGQIVDVEGWQDPDDEDAIHLGTYLRFAEEHVFAVMPNSGRDQRRA